MMMWIAKDNENGWQSSGTSCMVRHRDNLEVPFLCREMSMWEGETPCSLTCSSSPSTEDEMDIVIYVDTLYNL